MSSIQRKANSNLGHFFLSALFHIVSRQRETQDITLIFTFAFVRIHLLKAFNQTILLFEDLKAEKTYCKTVYVPDDW